MILYSMMMKVLVGNFEQKHCFGELLQILLRSIARKFYDSKSKEVGGENRRLQSWGHVIFFMLFFSAKNVYKRSSKK